MSSELSCCTARQVYYSEMFSLRNTSNRQLCLASSENVSLLTVALFESLCSERESPAKVPILFPLRVSCEQFSDKDLGGEGRSLLVHMLLAYRFTSC